MMGICGLFVGAALNLTEVQRPRVEGVGTPSAFVEGECGTGRVQVYLRHESDPTVIEGDYGKNTAGVRIKLW